MTHSCKAGECSITCEKGCGCIGSGSNCECVCDDSTRALKPFDKQLGLDDTLDIGINELSLTKVAVLLNAGCQQDILIPANGADSKVSLEAKGISMADALRQLGLVVAD